MDESKFVARNGRVNIKEIDKGVKNKFNWSWMEEKDHNDEYLNEYIRKVDEAGLAYCITCRERLKYGSSGKKMLHDHSKNKNHVKARNALKCTQSLPAVFTATKNLENCVPEKDLNPAPYGSSGNIVAMFQKMQRTSGQPSKPQPVPVSVIDRKSNQEGLICAFIAENNLPLGIAPKLISLAQELSKDPKALNELSMERISATYKMKQGVHLCMRKRLLQHMRSHTFSFNIDESTTKGSKKRVLNVLVCYYSDDLGESITDHYCSLEMTVVNSQTVYDAVTQQMVQDGIPLENLISVLSDSATYMRGCENGFHKRLQKDAPHLVDIDGDVCHHIHNTVKCFTSALDEENLLCKLLDDLHTDFKFSADLRDELKAVSEDLGLSALSPLERVPHRWLSLYDTTERLTQLTDQLTVFYFSWIPKQDKEAYKDIVIGILKKSSTEERKDIWTILSRLKSKNLTPAGKARKLRIVEKLFYKRKHLDFLMSVVVATLPLFKSFVLVFEQQAPLVHKLHDKMLETIRSFLASFIKLECMTDKKLLTLDPTDATCHLPLKSIFTEKKVAEILSSMRQADKTAHLQTLLAAYIKCTTYLQKKMPIANNFLQALSALDPIAHGNTASEDAMKGLAEYFPTVITPDKHDMYVKDVRAYHMNENLSPCDKIRLDHWWTSIMQIYPTLASVVRACLSIFCGPAVEQSFSMMNNIITPKTNRLDISTYAAYQGIKYHLLTRKLSAIQLFSRKDPVFDPIDKSMVFHVQTAKHKVFQQASTAVKKVRKDTRVAQSAHKKAVEQIAAIAKNNKRAEEGASEESLLEPPAPKRRM